jgi:hypothetical protein
MQHEPIDSEAHATWVAPIIPLRGAGHRRAHPALTGAETIRHLFLLPTRVSTEQSDGEPSEAS